MTEGENSISLNILRPENKLFFQEVDDFIDRKLFSVNLSVKCLADSLTFFFPVNYSESDDIGTQDLLTSDEAKELNSKNSISNKENIDYYEKLVRAFARLVVFLRDDLNKYEQFITDGASGIPVRDFLLYLTEHIYGKELLDLKKSELTIAGGRGVTQRLKKINELLKFKKFNPNKKTLIITEYLDSGSSLAKLIDSIQFTNVSVCVLSASANLFNQSYWSERLVKKNNGRLYVGFCGMLLYNRHHLHGFTKPSNTTDPIPERPKNQFFDLNVIRQTQEDIKLLAKKLSILIE